MVTDEPRGMWPAALPWNTTRTMADVWAEDPSYEAARVTGAMGGAATKAKRQQRKEAA